jgi:hypothetical protein
MLNEESKDDASSGAPTTSEPLSNLLRLDPKAGKRLRDVTERVLKRHGNDVTTAAAAVDMSIHGFKNILTGYSNGSPQTAEKMCREAGVPLASVLGDPLAKAYLATIELDRRKEEKAKRSKQPAPPPPAPAISVPRAVNGARVGEPIERQPLTPEQLEDLRQGRMHAGNMALLVDDYLSLREKVAKLHRIIFEKIYLKELGI